MAEADVRYWKIAPGSRGSLWVEQRDSNCIAVGWNEAGDLRKCKSFDQLEKKFKKLGYSGPNQLWRFYTDIKPGHKILAASGDKVFGLGTVELDDYDYREELVFHNAKAVKWVKKYWCPVSVDELKLPDETAKRIKGIRTIIELTEQDWALLYKKIQNIQTEFYEATQFNGLLMAPQSEQETIILFSTLRSQLNMRIISVGTRFPDAYIQVKDKRGNWVGKSAEFELYSSSFEKHGHDPKGCDMVICWEHDGDLPKGLEVIELKSKVKELL